MLKTGEMLFCCNTDVIQNFISFNFYDFLLNANRKNLLTVFLHALVWLFIVYCMKGCVTCYIKECWVMGLCCPSDIITINMSQSCVKLYECTKFATNIVGEMCTNSVTWFCAYLCKTEDTMNYACCNIYAAFYDLCQQISPKVHKFLSFAFKKSCLALCTF